MASATLDELQEFARRTAGSRHDAYSEQALTRAAAEYAPRRRERLARFASVVDGREFPSVFAAIRDPDVPFDTAELTLIDPPRDARPWEWSEPFDRIVFAPDGSAEVHPPAGEGKPRRAIVRFLLREHYVPRPESEALATSATASTGGLSPQLDPLNRAVAFVRKYGVVVFSAALLLYFSDQRSRLEVDLLDDALLIDPRAGRLPLARRVHRSARVSHAIDDFVSQNSLPVASARALEALVETHGLTPLDLAPMVGGVREYGASALQGLSARGLATFDRRTGVYRPRFDAFLSPADRAELGVPSIAPMPNPALRTSVMELLAAADSRAVCPLCGDALPPGPRTILCDRCQAEVGADTDAARVG
ncbi:MAG: hypothetical protein L3J73_02615 [Thermoplasmata archaeon]|nr:hypothetical protein [Thermoplasmata archaeon]